MQSKTKAEEWLTPQLVSLIAGEGFSAAIIRQRIAEGHLRAKPWTCGKQTRWLVHRSEAERFARSVRVGATT